MTVSLNRDEFLFALTAAARAVAGKSTLMPIEGILLRFEPGVMNIIGYNLEFGVFCKLKAETDETFGMIVQSKLICDIVRSLPSENVTLEIDKDFHCKLSSGSSRYELSCMSDEDFPELPDLSHEAEFTLSGKIFKSMSSETSFATDMNEKQKIVYRGVFFSLADGVLKSVGSDGYRLVVRSEAPEGIAPDAASSFVFPTASLREVERLVKDEDTLGFSFDKKQMIIACGGITFAVRLIEAKYISFEQSLRANTDKVYKINRADFLRTLDRVSIAIDEKIRTSVLFTFEDGVCTMTYTSPSAFVTDCCEYEGPAAAFKINLSCRYLQESLRYIKDDSLTLNAGSASTPILLKPVEGDSFVHVIAAMRS